MNIIAHPDSADALPLINRRVNIQRRKLVVNRRNLRVAKVGLFLSLCGIVFSSLFFAYTLVIAIGGK